ncbi:MAG: VIT domain-containing protein [Anaerolineales bacterium]
MKKIRHLYIILPFLLSFIPLSPAFADGIIIPHPPICEPGPCPMPVPISQLAIEYHRVDVRIENQVAITHVDQVFRNDNDWPIEGTYVFPIPDGAAITEFTLWIDGEPVEGEILTKEEARRTYEDIVRTMQDPALLEYIDRGAVQASVFPIPPGGERRIELEYSEILTSEEGLVRYSYPLNTEKFSTEPLEDVVVRVDVLSNEPIRAIYSPSHDISVEREGEYRFTAGYEDSFVTPDKDFDLYYSVAEDDIGLNLLTYRDPQGEDVDGFFLLIAAPSVDTGDQRAIPKDVIVVLDRSGSMDGEKFLQAQDALHYVLDHLNPEDRFNIIAFSTGMKTFARQLEGVDEVTEAHRWIDSLAAAGSTDINRALLEALDQTQAGRPTIIIFLTDGLPTEGETETEDILENIRRNAAENVRLFAFGVGYDVDTFLLDTLAQENRGATNYVTPGEPIDEIVSAFYAKVSLPVLVDLELDFGEITTFDLHPEDLPDLFAGTQLLVIGRYKNPGYETVELSGMVDGEMIRFRYPNQRFRSSGGSDFLPRLWATRKIGTLLNQIRLQGPDKELVDQVVKLSIRYGIVTPYTSYLVTEPMAFGANAQEGIADHAFEEMLAAPMEVTGEDAVGRAAAESEIKSAEAPLVLSQEAAEIVKYVGSRTFRLVDGVWIDTAFDPDRMDTVDVPFLSDEYFELANARAEFGDAFALGDRVIVVVDELAYQVIGEHERGDEITIPLSVKEDEGHEPEIVLAPEDVKEGEAAGGISLPCMGFSFLVGLTMLPMAKKKIAK